jgi:hypothetical protein
MRLNTFTRAVGGPEMQHEVLRLSNVVYFETLDGGGCGPSHLNHGRPSVRRSSPEEHGAEELASDPNVGM